MRFFETQISLRFVDDRYRCHQQVDTLMQERCQIRSPYSYRQTEAPNKSTFSQITIRSLVKMETPGEREVFFDVSEGDVIAFDCDFCSEIRFVQSNGQGESKKMARMGSYDEVLKAFKSAALKNGLNVLFVDSENPNSTPVKMKKPGVKPFTLGQFSLSVHAEVVDKALAENAIIQGIGKKRSFGFGMLFNLVKE